MTDEKENEQPKEEPKKMEKEKIDEQKEIEKEKPKKIEPFKTEQKIEPEKKKGFLKKLFNKKDEEEKNIQDKIKEIADESQETEKPSMHSRIEEISKQMEILTETKIKKGKPYKMPSKVRSKLKKLGKQKKVIVLKLYENAGADYEITKISDLMISIENAWRKCEPIHIFLLQGKHPLVVLPTWTMEPIRHFNVKPEDTVDNQTFIIKAAEREEAGYKKGMGEINWKGIIVIAGMIAVGVWVMFGGKTGL